MMFIGNLNYVLVAVVGGLRVASGSLSLGDVQAFIQYSRQFSQPLTQVASMAMPSRVDAIKPPITGTRLRSGRGFLVSAGARPSLQTVERPCRT